MIADPNRPLEDLLIHEHEGTAYPNHLENVEPVMPDELPLTPSERSASRRKYLLSFSITIFFTLVLLALLFLALR